MAEQRTAEWLQQELHRGLRFLNGGQINEADRCVRSVIDAQPDHPQAHFLAGLIALRANQTGPAINAFSAAVKIDPLNGAAWAHLAQLFVMHGDHERADAALAEAIAQSDGSANQMQLIGVVTSMFGDHAGAQRWYENATRLEPGNLGFRINHAQCLMYLGQLDAAEDMILAALKIQPNFPNAHWLLSGYRKATSREHIEQMQAILAGGRLAPGDVAFLCYACGKELEDLEEWDMAFAAFANGAAAQRSTVSFDEQAEIDLYASLENQFTQEWLATGGQGVDDPSPIFVVGQPRTGTTLVERIIAAHSQVDSAGELKQFGNAVRRLADWQGGPTPTARDIEASANIDPAKLGDAYLDATRRVRGDAKHFVDKLPLNFLYLPLILKALPGARIVHLRRDPMDACFSSFKQLFADAYPHSYDQQEMARHHARYHHLMAVWRERFGERYHEVAYEDVARDLETNARAIIDYLDLPWEDACREFHKQKTAVATASAAQVRQAVHTKSIGRWRRYAEQLGPARAILEANDIPFAD